MKKAQGISMNTIVIAAIALTVMILIVLITTTNLKSFGLGARNCENNGGTCVENVDVCTAAPYEGTVSSKKCNTDGYVCCISPYE